MALRELLVSLGVEVSGKEELERVDGKLTSILNHAEKVVTALGGLALVKGIGSFITDTIEMGAQLGFMADKLGIGTQELQSFQYAGQMVGISADQAAKSLQLLQRHVGLAAIGNKAAAKDFAQLGVSLRDANGEIKPTSELLPAIGEGFNKLKSQPEKLAFAMKVFGRGAGASMVPLLERLKESQKEFEALGGGLKDDFIEKAKDADRAMTRLKISFDNMKSRAVLPLIPAFEQGVSWLIQFFNAMGHLSDITYGAQTALIALGAVAAVALAPLVAETLAVVAPWVALYLLFDDIFTLFEGGDSIIGRVIDSLFGVGASKTFVADVKAEVSDLWDRLKNLVPTIQSIRETFAEWGPVLKPVFQFLFKAVEKTLQSLGGLARVITDVAGGDFRQAGIDVMKTGDAVFGVDQKKDEADKEQANRDYFAKFRAEIDRKNNPTLAASLPNAPTGENQETDNGYVGLGGGGQGFSMTGDINVQVAVQGGATNGETGSAVGNAAADATHAALRDAHAAIKARK